MIQELNLRPTGYLILLIVVAILAYLIVTTPSKVDAEDIVENILRLVVKKSPTGESTHYFFFMIK